MLNYQRVFFESLTISNHLRDFEPGSIMLWSPSEEYFCTKQSKHPPTSYFQWIDFYGKIDTGKPHDLLMGKSRWSPVKIFPSFWSTGPRIRQLQSLCGCLAMAKILSWEMEHPSDKHTTVGGLEHVFHEKLGMSSSQLTNSYFSEGWLKTTNQHIKSYWSRHRKFVDLPMTNGVPCKFTVCYWSHGHRKFVDLPMTNGDFPSVFCMFSRGEWEDRGISTGTSSKWWYYFRARWGWRKGDFTKHKGYPLVN